METVYQETQRNAKKYDFDKITERKGTNCWKYDFVEEYGKPEDILSMWVADMDFPVADEIQESLLKYVQHGIFGYCDRKNTYFQAVEKWMKTYHNWQVKEEWMINTPGVVFAIAAAIRALTEKGDRVIIQSPVYYPFRNMVLQNERVLVDNTLVEENGQYRMDLEDFERKVKEEQVKLFILCNPHNPIGRVWTKEELKKVGEICLKYGVNVISDEIHHDFVNPGYEHSIFQEVDERFREITVTCTAPSKTFNIAGLQVSNIFIPNATLRERFQKKVSCAGYSSLNTLGIVACESAYNYGREWFEQVQQYIKGNLDFLRAYVRENMPDIKLVEPEGTYLAWLDCRGLGMEAKELDEFVVNKAKLWLDDGGMFGKAGEGFQRINLACPRSVLVKALEQLECAIVNR